MLSFSRWVELLLDIHSFVGVLLLTHCLEKVMDLFMSSLREAIYSVDPQSQLVSHPDLRFYKSQLARFLRSTSAIQEEAETQSGSGVRLSDWCRVLFGTDVDAHNRECVDARRVATKKVSF